MRTLPAATVVAAMIVAACSGPPGTTPIALPADVPMTMAECGWPANTPILVAQKADFDMFNLPASLGNGDPQEEVYLLATLGWVEFTPTGGTATVKEMGACVKGADGRVVTTALPRDWSEPHP